jgi:hypothetical protein
MLLFACPKSNQKGQKIPKLRPTRPTLGPRDFWAYPPALPCAIGVDKALFITDQMVLRTLPYVLIMSKLYLINPITRVKVMICNKRELAYTMANTSARRSQ